MLWESQNLLIWVYPLGVLFWNAPTLAPKCVNSFGCQWNYQTRGVNHSLKIPGKSLCYEKSEISHALARNSFEKKSNIVREMLKWFTPRSDAHWNFNRIFYLFQNFNLFLRYLRISMTFYKSTSNVWWVYSHYTMKRLSLLWNDARFNTGAQALLFGTWYRSLIFLSFLRHEISLIRLVDTFLFDKFDWLIVLRCHWCFAWLFRSAEVGQKSCFERIVLDAPYLGQFCPIWFG